MIVSLIVAYALDRKGNRVIGKDNKIPWHRPNDLRRFKEFTSGYPVLMGRKTQQSIGRVLPDRENIVVSSDPEYSVPGVHVVSSVDVGLEYAREKQVPEIFIIGGQKIYEQTVSRADRLYITRIHLPSVQGDTFFPDYDLRTYREIYSEEDGQDTFHIYQRVQKPKDTSPGPSSTATSESSSEYNDVDFHQEYDF